MVRRIVFLTITSLFIWGCSGSSGQEQYHLTGGDCKGLAAIAGQSCYTLGDCVGE